MANATYDRSELARLPKEDIIETAIVANKKWRSVTTTAKEAFAARKETMLRFGSGLSGGIAVGAIKGHVEATVFNELGNEANWTEDQEKEANAIRNLFGFLPKTAIAPTVAAGVAMARPKGVKDWQLGVMETFAIGGFAKILGDMAEEFMLDRADVARAISYAEEVDEDE